MKPSTLGLVICMSFLVNAPAFGDSLVQTPLWQSGENGYHTYRIPAMAVTSNGTLLVFCEGRKQGGSDAGNIDLLIRRSVDQGLTWSGQCVVWDDANNTCGNPCPVVDKTTGVIWLFATWNRGDDYERQMLCLYECGKKSPYESIVLARFFLTDMQ